MILHSKHCLSERAIACPLSLCGCQEPTVCLAMLSENGGHGAGHGVDLAYTTELKSRQRYTYVLGNTASLTKWGSGSSSQERAKRRYKNIGVIATQFRTIWSRISSVGGTQTHRCTTLKEFVRMSDAIKGAP